MHSNTMSFALRLAAVVTLCGGCVVPPEEMTAPTEDSSATSHEAELRKARTYRVTVQNVTAGNGLSPPLVVTHARDYRLFSVGARATRGIAEVAETGGTATLEAELKNVEGVGTVVKAQGGPIGAGQARVIDVTVSGSALARGERLNLVAMIGRSNDSFVSLVGGVDLPSIKEKEVILFLTNFDAGSEENTGNTEDFGAGGHPIANAEGFISYDRGLNPRGNAPEIAAWGPIAAVVSIVRIE